MQQLQTVTNEKEAKLKEVEKQKRKEYRRKRKLEGCHYTVIMH